jgi:Tfp pilus assembly protein FimV
MADKKDKPAEPGNETTPDPQDLQQQLADLQRQLELKEAQQKSAAEQFEADLQQQRKVNEALMAELDAKTSPAALTVGTVATVGKVPLREYEVIPTGQNANEDGLSRERVLAHDPSDAKRVYFVKRGIEQTSRYQLQVQQVHSS